jgi:nucleotide-binding universal stress UspA family protein
MLPIHHILHPTDFSESSATAFRLAATLAHDYGARLTVLHVAIPPPIMIAGELPVVMTPADTSVHVNELLAQLREVKTGYNDVIVERKLVEGDPATEILGMAETLEADFIVMGTHGRTGFARLLMGSVAEVVSRKAKAPVLLVKEPLKAARPVRPTLEQEAAREAVAASA